MADSREDPGDAEITPEMIEAGREAIAGYDPHEHVESMRDEFLVVIYSAMASAYSDKVSESSKRPILSNHPTSTNKEPK